MFISTVICNLILIVFFCIDGTSDWAVEVYQEEAIIENESFIFMEHAASGSYEVKTVDYGMEKTNTIKSATVDLSDYIGGYNFARQIVRDTYFGYSMREVPLVGQVWYPSEKKNCPVVFVVHGNHTAITKSYMGYAYLGEHLASQGYVVVSIDENSCNYYIDQGLDDENDARAVLLLEHLKQLELYNEEKGNPLFQTMDYDNIALVGHSRGGEAVSIATYFNQLNYNPEQPMHTFDYHFNIKSVVAIAPTSGQYQLPKGKIELEDVNYLLIQGANDQDVTCFQGIREYNNVTYSKKDDYFKSYLYIYGANHGQFNTEWGRKDLNDPFSFMLNTDSLMSGEKQRLILKGFLSTFLDVTLEENKEGKLLFQEYELFCKQMPDTLYIQGYEDSSFYTVADYETYRKTEIEQMTKDLKYGKNEKVQFPEDKAFDTNNTGFHIKWNDYQGQYNLTMTENGLDISQMEVLQFDIMNQEIFNTEGINCTLMLIDVDGNQASLPLSGYQTVTGSLPVALYKLQTIVGTIEYKQLFQTVRVPLQEFKNENSILDLSQIKSIRFVFDRQESGNIMLDNIGFSQ